jgi:arabinoxylan arabinofuranohydrolase
MDCIEKPESDCLGHRAGIKLVPLMGSRKISFLLLGMLTASSLVFAENPLVTNIFTADPSGRVFNGRLYVYTSHDLPDATYWDMTDWRLLSTDDLVTWKDHGSIFRVKDFAWATHWAWAPDAIEANGKYYLFLPVDRTKIGVAVGENPDGPFKDAIGQPLIDNAKLPDAGPEPIDPALLQDDDGQTYLYFGCRKPEVAKLKSSLTELDGGLQTLSILDAQGKPVPMAAPGKDPVLPEGYAEAPFVFKRGGKYYFVYSDGWAPTATLVYAIGDHPTGPFTYVGKVMEHAASVTQHGSVVEFKGKWYVLYHTSELSNGNAFRRSVCIDELKFDASGRIIAVVPTRGGPAAAR